MAILLAAVGGEGPIAGTARILQLRRAAKDPRPFANWARRGITRSWQSLPDRERSAAQQRQAPTFSRGVLPLDLLGHASAVVDLRRR